MLLPYQTPGLPAPIKKAPLGAPLFSARMAPLTLTPLVGEDVRGAAVRAEDPYEIASLQAALCPRNGTFDELQLSVLRHDERLIGEGELAEPIDHPADMFNGGNRISTVLAEEELLVMGIYETRRVSGRLVEVLIEIYPFISDAVFEALAAEDAVTPVTLYGRIIGGDGRSYQDDED